MPPKKRGRTNTAKAAEGNIGRHQNPTVPPNKKARHEWQDADEDSDAALDALLFGKSKYTEQDDDEASDSMEDPLISNRVKKTATKAAPRKKNRPSKKAPEPEDESSLDEENADDEEAFDSDDSGVRREVFIPHKQLRGDGGIPYEDGCVHMNTLLFLRELKENNYRAWLKDNDKEYRRALTDWNSFIETINPKISAIDDKVPLLDIKQVVFRIYRDIRFSKDHTPYKPYLSAAWSQTGRRGIHACYYLHLEPDTNSSFVGGGLFHPSNHVLAKLRASIDERPHRWEAILTDPKFRSTFLLTPPMQSKKTAKKSKVAAKGRGRKTAANTDDGGSEVNAESSIGDWETAKTMFAAANATDALKTKPKGYSSDHCNISLLKLKNFTVSKKFKAEDVTGPKAHDTVLDTVAAMVDFVRFLDRIMLDEEEDTEDEDDGEEGS